MLVFCGLPSLAKPKMVTNSLLFVYALASLIYRGAASVGPFIPPVAEAGFAADFRPNWWLIVIIVLFCGSSRGGFPKVCIRLGLLVEWSEILSFSKEF